jgi:alcohol dehydrogenase
MKSFRLYAGKTTLYFGPNGIERLAEHMKGVSRAFIVTSKNAARISGALKDVEKVLKEREIECQTFDKVFPNPTTKLVDEMAGRIWSFKADTVIAIGGGSVIDSAKLASVVACGGGKAEEYVKGSREPVMSISLYAINLTHGTGTEVDGYAVATIEETKEKLGNRIAYPDVSVDDPAYLLTLPKKHTIYTALDALYHAIEASTTVDSSPYSGMLSEEVVRLMVKWLPTAVREPKSLEARYWLLYASMLAGIAIDNARTHIIHGLEHALSGLRPKLAHGAGLAIIGPKLVRYTYRARPEVLSRVLKPLAPDLRGIEEEGEDVEKVLEEFQRSVGFEERLSDYGLSENDVDAAIGLVNKSLKWSLEEAPFEPTDKILRDVLLKSL